jgi:PAS domain S-box-containing protein
MRRRYECLLDHLDHAFVWEADPATLQVLYASAHAEAMLGFAPECWLSGPDFWKMRVHPEDRDTFEQTLRKAAATETDQRCDHRCVTADGRTIWLHTGVHLAPSNGRASTSAGRLGRRHSD